MTDLDAKAVSLRHVEWAREHETAWDKLIEIVQYLTEKELVDMMVLYDRPGGKKRLRRLARSQNTALGACARAVEGVRAASVRPS